MRIFFSAGEASGDAYAAELLNALRCISSEKITAEGIGGQRLLSAGATLAADSSKWGAISILQSLKMVPRVARVYWRAKAALASGAPGLFIPIDFGYINIRLCRHAKKHGWKVLYFIPPGSWRRDKHGKDLPAVTDEIVTPFPWSAEILNGMGAKAHFFGHPLKQMIRGGQETGKRRTVAVLPGSRHHEINENLPILAEVFRGAPADRTDINYQKGGCLPPGPERLEFAVAQSVDLAALTEQWRQLTGRTFDTFTQGDTYGVLGRARAAIVCSGTATLEAALCRCPMVVMYRFSKLTEFEIRLRGVRPKFISLPNILLDRQVVPELIQNDATPEAIRTQLDALLTEGPPRQAQLDAFEELDQELGPEDAITKTAELAVRMLR